MNTLKRSSLAILSLGLLLSAPAYAGFADLYAQAGQAAQNLWAKRSVITNALPSVSMPKLSMPAISLPAVSLPKISMPSMPQVSMPSRAQVEAGFETFAEYLQKTEGVMAQYPKTVAATKMAAKVVPVAVVGGYLAKKVYDNHVNQPLTAETQLKLKLSKIFEEKDVVAFDFNSWQEAVKQLDKDLIAGMHITAIKVLSDAQAQITECIEKRANKIPKELNFEENLGRYLAIVPDYLPGLKKDWNSFITLAIAYDNANHTAFGQDLVTSFEKVINRLATLNALIERVEAERISTK